MKIKDAFEITKPLNAEALMSNHPVNQMTKHQREASGLLPSLVTVRIQGDIQRQTFLDALHAAGLDTYTDCTQALCVCSPEYAKAHRELLQAERAARLEHAQRHAALVKMEGDRNAAHGYQKCMDETATVVNGRWVCNCPAPTRYRETSNGPFEPSELRELPEDLDDDSAPL